MHPVETFRPRVPMRLTAMSRVRHAEQQGAMTLGGEKTGEGVVMYTWILFCNWNAVRNEGLRVRGGQCWRRRVVIDDSALTNGGEGSAYV